MFQSTDSTLMIMGKQIPIQNILQQIMSFRDSEHTHLVSKFSLEYMISLIDRNKIAEIQHAYNSYLEGFNIFDFSRFFLNTIQHSEDQTLYLTMAIIDLFKQVAFFNNVSERILFSHITNYICKGILSQRDNQYHIKGRLLPHQRRLNPSQSIRQVEVFAPIVYGKTGQQPVKLSKAKIKADRTKHTGIITNIYYSHTKRNIFCLDSLSQFIRRYDINAQMIGKITPTSSKIKRDALIISFAYSQRQERIGALLKNLQLIFWDTYDDFKTEKSFSTSKYSSEQQVNIWFLQYHNQWVTTDTYGGLCVWNLQTEEAKQSIKLKNKITDVCQIRCLNLIAISQQKSGGRKDETQSKIVLYNLVKNSVIVQIGLGAQSFKHRSLNYLQFSNTYQILLYGDSSKQITLLQIDPQFFDATNKGKLIGHQYVVINFILIKKTPTVVSCDDKQKIKIWDIRNCSCVQTLDFQGKTVISRLVSMVRVDKFAIVGGRIYIVDIEKRQDSKLQKMLQRQMIYPMSVYFESASKQLLVFTKNDLRFYQIQTGKVNRVFTGFVDSQQQVTSLKYLNSCRAFVLGTYQGVLRIHSKLSGNLSKTLLSHTKQITCINYDSLNHIFVTSSFDSHIFIQKQKDGRSKFQLIRSIKDNFFKRQVTLCQISVYHNFLAVGGAQQKMIYIWDYEFCKLLCEIQLKGGAQPTVISFINGYSMMLIGDNQGRVTVIQIERIDNYSAIPHLVCVFELYQSPTHFLIDVGLKQPQRLFVAVKKGTVWQIDLTKILLKYRFEKHASSRPNYNPQRQLNQSFISEYGKKLFKTLNVEITKPVEYFNQQLMNSFKAHQDDLTSIIMLNLKEKNLCTCSVDRRLKIWSNTKEIICDTNINMSLPYKWKVEISNEQFLKSRIMFALKVLEVIVNRNKSTITLNEWSMLKISGFFRSLINDHQGFVTETFSNKIPVKMMCDQFQKDDLDYQRAKKYYFKEIAGPRLKQMQAKKRTKSIQKNLRLAQQKADEQKYKVTQQLKLKKVKSQQKQLMLQMFKNPNQTRNNTFKLQNRQIFMKLERLLNKPSFQGQQSIKQNHPQIISKQKQIRINRHRTRNTTKKHISFQQYYQRKSVQTVGETINVPKTSQVQSRCKKQTFGKVLFDLNQKVKWKRLLHTRSYDRRPKFDNGLFQSIQ